MELDSLRTRPAYHLSFETRGCADWSGTETQDLWMGGAAVSRGGCGSPSWEGRAARFLYCFIAEVGAGYRL